MEKAGVDALIPIGGEDTLGVAGRLAADGVPVVGVPKTIDNDLAGTDYTFGFDTAVQIATDAIDRLHTTAESHNRVLVVEVMGRHAGWIACHSGMAGGADVILVPERPFDIDDVCAHLRARHARGRSFSIVVASEGAQPAEGSLATKNAEVDEFGHVRLGGIAAWLEQEIEQRTGFETRMVVLGHVQRGGTPTAFDRVLATRFGVEAIDALTARRVRAHGRAARDRHRHGPARRRARRAQAARPGAVRDRRGLLRMRWLAACAVLAALILAGCGGNDVEKSNAYVDSVNIAQTRFASSFERLAREITSTSTPAAGRRDAAQHQRGDRRDRRGPAQDQAPPDKVKAQHDQLVEAIADYGKAITAAESKLGGSAAQATAAEARLAADSTRTSTRVNEAVAAINQKLRD